MSNKKNTLSKLNDFVSVRTVIERMQSALGAKTDQEFADMLGIGSAQTISQYKRGVRDLPWEVIVKFSRLSGESLDWIILGRVSVKNEKVVGRVPNHSFSDLEQWASTVNDGLEYGPIVKAMVAKEYPKFAEWLREKKQSELGENTTVQENKYANSK